MLALAAALLLASSTAPASARPVLGAAVTAPSEFVPNWDGHTDSAIFAFRLHARSNATVRVLDSSGRTIHVIARGPRAAGLHRLSWDGRLRGGVVADPGSYTIRVDARPLGAARATLRSGRVRASAAPRPGARSATVTVRAPKVTLTSVQLSRTTLGRTRSAQRTGARFRLSVPAAVSAAVVDSTGKVVRTLASGRQRAGVSSLSWDGRTNAGADAPDGAYAIAISATGGGMPTSTKRLPITVDRTVPNLSVPARTSAALIGRAGVRVSIPVRTSEAGTLIVRHGVRQSAPRDIARGTTRQVIDGSDIGLIATAAARTVRLQLLLRDGAGNLRMRTVSVFVPKKRATSPQTPPPPTDDVDPVISQPTGAWPWPIDGIVTSEFGMRDGRPHEGLDIAGPTGTPIHPSKAGTISFVGDYGGYGNLVIVDHGGGLTTRYAHMSRFGSFGVGDSVNHVSVIGHVGCTGSCSGPHVHFEVRTGERARNPRAYLTRG